jgi:hypothetical protein
MFVTGGVGSVLFVFIFVIALFKTRLVLLDVLCFIPVLLLPFELLYEGLYSRIEVSNTGIVYHQPRFTLSCKWEDLMDIVDSGFGTTLLFSTASVLRGKWIATLLKLLGPWERSIPFSCYISPQNAKKVWHVISANATNLNTEAKT